MIDLFDDNEDIVSSNRARDLPELYPLDLNRPLEGGLSYEYYDIDDSSSDAAPRAESVYGGALSDSGVDSTGALRAALLNLRLYSPFGNVTRLSAGVCRDVPGSGSRWVAVRDCIGFITMNVVRNRANDRRRLLVVSLRASDYSDLSVSYRTIVKALTVLTDKGLIELYAKGFRNPDTSRGYRTRYKPTQRYFDLIAEYGITPSMVLTKPRPGSTLIQVRSTEGETVPWPRAHRAPRKVAEANLRAINQAINDSLIALHVPGDELDVIHDRIGRKQDGRLIDFQDKEMIRVYNDGSHEKGGRYYGGWWQNIPSAYRKHLHIATPTEPTPAHTHELDYEAQHARILLALEKHDCPSDPYLIYGADTTPGTRRVIKKLFLCLVNNIDRGTALQAAYNAEREYYKENMANGPLDAIPKNVTDMLPPGCPPIPELLADIERELAPIAKYFYTGIGKRLMWLDSQLAEAVMLGMLKDHGTIALPIHDSFIVRTGYEAQLEQCMKQAFWNAFGADIPVSHDITEPQQASEDAKWGTGDFPFGSDDYSVYKALVADWEQSRDCPPNSRKATRNR